jgi:hypothetical protein
MINAFIFNKMIIMIKLLQHKKFLDLLWISVINQLMLYMNKNFLMK